MLSNKQRTCAKNLQLICNYLQHWFHNLQLNTFSTIYFCLMGGGQLHVAPQMVVPVRNRSLNVPVDLQQIYSRFNYRKKIIVQHSMLYLFLILNFKSIPFKHYIVYHVIILFFSNIACFKCNIFEKINSIIV